MRPRAPMFDPEAQTLPPPGEPYYAVYVAAAFGEKEAARAFVDMLPRCCMAVSTWHGLTETEDPSDVDLRTRAAGTCLREVDAADVLVVLQVGRPRGAYVEAGYALGKGKPVIWVGTDGPVFDSMGICVPTPEEAVRWLSPQVFQGVPERVMREGK